MISQCGIIDHRAARSSHQNGVILHQTQFGIADEMIGGIASGLGQRRMKRYGITLGQEVAE